MGFWIKRSAILLAAALLCLLCGCGDTEDAPRPGIQTAAETAETVSPAEVWGQDDLLPPKCTYITSMSDWETFDADGYFSDNCKNFLWQFLGGNTSPFMEFDTVRVSDYVIARCADEDVYGASTLYFRLRVKASALPTLPVGDYRMLVHDLVDCTVDFIGDDPRGKAPVTATEDACGGILADFLTSAYAWNCPAFGAWRGEPVNYIIHRYGANGEMRYDDYKKICKEKFGITADKENGAFTVKDGKLWILAGALGGGTVYSVSSHTEVDGAHLVTVRFFADAARFIPASQVEYKIGADEVMYGSRVVESSPYPPYGLRTMDW